MLGVANEEAAMRHIDLETWERREHYQLFSSMGFPYFGLTANVDLTAFRAAVKARGASFTVALMYVLSMAANAVPAFRQRIREGGVVEHEVVHPGTTILVSEDLFRFCLFVHDADWSAFAADAAQRIARVKERPSLGTELDRDELLYTTAIPWVSFTNCLHPVFLHGADSVPRIAWGKYFEDRGRLLMPLNIQVHHGLVDGIHAARFYEGVQAYLSDPEATLGGGA
jgi:chloramphenicol O-acetyltransferase type A